MYSITVQGTHTGTFQFRHGSGHEFRSFVESLVLNAATLICSRYRIDLLYYSETDRHEDIIRAWCKIVGKDFNPEIKRKFLRTKGRKETLEHYFTSLIHLARMPYWFQDYKTQLNLTFYQEPYHLIHREIIDCALHLSSRNHPLDLPLVITDPGRVAHFLFKTTKSFASEAAGRYLKN